MRFAAATKRRLALLAVAMITGASGVVALPATTGHAAAPVVNLFAPSFSPQYGQNFSIQAAVADPLNQGAVTDGTLTFLVNGVPYGPCVNLAVGVGFTTCFFATGAVLPGTHSITAQYRNSAVWDDANSAPVSVTVLKGRTDMTYTGPTTAAPGGTVAATATLERDYPAGPFAGVPVTFRFETAGTSCSTTTNASGLAACSLPAPPTNDLIVARYEGDSVYAATEDQSSVSVSIPTSITVNAPGSFFWGTSVQFGASLTPANVTGGTVSFTYGGGSPVPGCASVAVNASAASCTSPGLPPGAHQIVGHYSGSGAYAASSSVPFPVTALAHPLAVQLTSASPGMVGVPYEVSGTVTNTVNNAPSASRSVTFQLGPAQCMATSNASGAAACTLTPQAAGPATLTMATPSDSQYVGAQVQGTIDIAPGSTVTTVIGGNGTFGQAVNLNAIVGPDTTAGATSFNGVGTVDFARNGVPIAGCQGLPLALIVGEYRAICSVLDVPIGAHTYEATYSGSPDYSASTGNAEGTVSKAPTQLTYTGVTSATVNGAAELSATLTANGGPLAGQPIAFDWAGRQCNGTTDANGVGTCSLPAESVTQGGTVVVTYDGNVEYLPSASAPVEVAITAASTTTTLDVPTGLVFSVPVALRAVVSPTNAAGTVAFTLDGAPLPGCAAVAVTVVLGVAEATCTALFVPAGSATFGAEFSGTADFSGSIAAPQERTIAAAPTMLMYDGDTSVTVLVPFTAAAVLTNIAGEAVPVEGVPVTFEWAGDICTATTDADGRATCTLTPANVGQSGPIVVDFDATTEYLGSNVSDQITVARGDSTTSLDGPATAQFGEPVTLTATVTPAPVSGAVAFLIADDPLPGCEAVALAELAGEQRATCSTTALPAGNVTITAAYAGDVDYLGSSADTDVAVTPADTELTYTGATTGTVAAAAQLSARLTALPNGGSPVVGVPLEFTVGGLSCTGITGVAGTASCEVVPTDIGQAGTVQVSFAGTDEYDTAATTGALELESTPTSTNLEGPTAAHFGSSVSFIATVTPSAGTGTVSFAADNAPIVGCQSLPLVENGSSWRATCTTAALGVGSHAIVAAFAGTSSYDVSTSDVLTVDVGAAPVRVIYTGDTSAKVGAPLSVSARLLADTGSSTAGIAPLLTLAIDDPGVGAQTVTFRLGGATCSAVTDDTGRAGCALTPTSAGVSTLGISFGGSATYQPVTLTLELMVAPASTPSTQPLPATGSNPATLTMAAAALLALGLGARRVTRLDQRRG